MNELKIAFRFNAQNPTPAEKVMISIIESVEQGIIEGLQNEETCFSLTPTRSLIMMTVCNIMTHLFRNSLNKNISLKKRLELANDLAKDISELFIDSIQQIEVNYADMSEKH